MADVEIGDIINYSLYVNVLVVGEDGSCYVLKDSNGNTKRVFKELVRKYSVKLKDIYIGEFFVVKNKLIKLVCISNNVCLLSDIQGNKVSLSTNSVRTLNQAGVFTIVKLDVARNMATLCNNFILNKHPNYKVTLKDLKIIFSEVALGKLDLSYTCRSVLKNSDILNIAVSFYSSVIKWNNI